MLLVYVALPTKTIAIFASNYGDVPMVPGHAKPMGGHVVSLSAEPCQTEFVAIDLNYFLLLEAIAFNYHLNRKPLIESQFPGMIILVHAGLTVNRYTLWRDG